MPTQKKIGDLKLLQEISEYLSDISGVKNVMQYYWNAGIYAEKLLDLCYDKQQISFPIDISKIADKLGIVIEDVNINDFSNEHIKRSNHKIAQVAWHNPGGTWKSSWHRRGKCRDKNCTV